MLHERATTTVSANGHQRRQWHEAAGFTQGAVTYYDRPMIKKPTWKGFIPGYIYLGGVAGGAAVVGAAAEFFGGKRHRATVRHARYLSAGLAPACAALLIADLGRPTRFHHMLRVFKISSPLSVGTWVLSAFGATAGMLAARQAAEDGFILRRESLVGRLLRRVPSGPITAANGVLGLGLGGYTGTVIAATAVPVWSEGGILMGPFFLASAMSSGAAALRLMGRALGTATTTTDADIGNVQLLATIAELSLEATREARVPKRVNRPLRHGLWGKVYTFGAVGAGMVGSLVLSVAGRIAPPRLRQTIATTTAALGMVGAFAERFALVEAGKKSAEDPIAYQEVTRGAPGVARPTAEEQARQAPADARTHPFQHAQVVPER